MALQKEERVLELRDEEDLYKQKKGKETFSPRGFSKEQASWYLDSGSVRRR